MFAVAISELTGDPEAVARKLQEAGGRTLYEERQRIGRAFPRVVATCADRQAADLERAALVTAGARAVVIDCDAIEQDAERLVIRRFALEPEALAAETHDGRRVAVPYAAMSTLIRGLEIASQTDTVTTKKRKLSFGRAIATGGLVTHKKVKKESTTRSERRGAYLLVYARDTPTLALRESTLIFSNLGDAKQASRAANFGWLVDQLRARAPGAVYDERLMTRAGQKQLLGALDVEIYTDLAVALVSYACWLETRAARE